jgi:hypothetical protein
MSTIHIGLCGGLRVNPASGNSSRGSGIGIRITEESIKLCNSIFHFDRTLRQARERLREQRNLISVRPEISIFLVILAIFKPEST